MTYFFGALLRNLVAGARVGLFVPVRRPAFRFDLWQWVAMVVVSALVDIALDALRAKPGTQFSVAGVDGELYALGLLMLTSGILGALFRDVETFVALPIVVLAAFLPVQVVHALPAIVNFAWPPHGGAYFDVVMLAWMLAVCVRSVWVVSDSPGGRARFFRAVAGGVLLSLPLWVGPLGGPFEGWWTTPDEEQDSESPSPASEPVLAVQSDLLDDALDALEDQRPGVIDLYFVGFAPDSRHEGFRDELEKAQHVLDERFDTRDRSLLLLNNRSTVTELPYATLTNLRKTLQEIGGAIDPEEDVVMLYLTGGTTDDHALAAVHPPLDLVDVTPAAVKQLLDSAGIRYRVIVVSACAAGAWAETLQDDDTALLVAAPGDAEPAGCEGGDSASPLAEALFDRALRTADSLPAALMAAAHDVGDQATTLWIGPNVATQLERLRHGAPTRTAALR
jgi:hypothetical protein